jgi:hypothetical protein
MDGNQHRLAGSVQRIQPGLRERFCKRFGQQKKYRRKQDDYDRENGQCFFVQRCLHLLIRARFQLGSVPVYSW